MEAPPEPAAPVADGPQAAAPPPEGNPELPTVGRWAVVVRDEDRDRAREALRPLIEHRRGLGHLWGADGILPVRRSLSGALASWRRRFLRGANDQPPYYLLLVGGPDRLPFELQFDLDGYRATGRVDVSDEPGGPFSWEACRRWAERAVAYETGALGVAQPALVYSVAGDEGTRLAHRKLVEPVVEELPGAVTRLTGPEATVCRLCEALGASPAPRLVFTASHGVEFPDRDDCWGALTDVRYRGRAGDAVVSAEVAATKPAFAHGSVVFSFACFSAGVPGSSVVSFLAGDAEVPVEMGARTAALPRQLLGHPAGPVAFIGHVDRVSARAFARAFGRPGAAPYQDFAGWLGHRAATLGRALGTLREHALRGAKRVTEAQREAAAEPGSDARLQAAGEEWIAYHDHRGFLLLGDPALRPR